MKVGKFTRTIMIVSQAAIDPVSPDVAGKLDVTELYKRCLPGCRYGLELVML